MNGVVEFIQRNVGVGNGRNLINRFLQQIGLNPLGDVANNPFQKEQIALFVKNAAADILRPTPFARPVLQTVHVMKPTLIPRSSSIDGTWLTL
jgi:hypothetical protein